MLQKLFQTGNSLGVVIPSNLRREVGFKPGTRVFVAKGPDDDSVIIRNANADLGSPNPALLQTDSSAAAARFYAWLTEFIENFQSATQPKDENLEE